MRQTAVRVREQQCAVRWLEGWKGWAAAVLRSRVEVECRCFNAGGPWVILPCEHLFTVPNASAQLCACPHLLAFVNIVKVVDDGTIFRAQSRWTP